MRDGKSYSLSYSIHNIADNQDLWIDARRHISCLRAGREAKGDDVVCACAARLQSH